MSLRSRLNDLEQIWSNWQKGISNRDRIITDLTKRVEALQYQVWALQNPPKFSPGDNITNITAGWAGKVIELLKCDDCRSHTTFGLYGGCQSPYTHFYSVLYEGQKNTSVVQESHIKLLKTDI